MFNCLKYTWNQAIISRSSDPLCQDSCMTNSHPASLSVKFSHLKLLKFCQWNFNWNLYNYFSKRFLIWSSRNKWSSHGPNLMFFFRSIWNQSNTFFSLSLLLKLYNYTSAIYHIKKENLPEKILIWWIFWPSFGLIRNP